VKLKSLDVSLDFFLEQYLACLRKLEIMKFIGGIIAVVFVFMSFISFSNIDFKNLTIKQAIELAQKENKKVFIDFYSTACPPCKIMEKDVFTDSAVSAYINEHFISVRSNAASIEGKLEKFEYKINAYPTLLFLSPEGKELTRFIGGRNKDIFLAEIQTIEEKPVNDIPNDKPIKPEVDTNLYPIRKLRD
jgi:thioredoxin-related protein